LRKRYAQTGHHRRCRFPKGSIIGAGSRTGRGYNSRKCLHLGCEDADLRKRSAEPEFILEINEDFEQYIDEKDALHVLASRLKCRHF
jgi:hypothetical protein